MEALTFDDNTADLFLSQDVLENLFNPENAIDEMLHVIKPFCYVYNSNISWTQNIAVDAY